MAALNSRKADVVLGYPVNGYDGTKYLSTGELSKANVCMAVRKTAPGGLGMNPAERSFSKAVFELGSIDYAYLQSMGIKQFISVNSQKRVAEVLMKGDTDIAVGTSESLEYILEREGVAEQYKILHNQIASISYSILLNMDNQRLRAMLDTELAELRTGGGYEKIYDSHITSRDLNQARIVIQRLLTVGLVVTLSAFLIIGIIAKINRMLREKVAEKTEELYRANTLLEQQVVRLKNESSLRSRIIEAVPTGILFLSRDFHVTLMNPAAQIMCGVFDDTAGGASINSIPLFGHLMERLEQKVILPRQREQQCHLVELENADDKGKYRCWFHWLKDISGGMLLMVENVTGEEEHRRERFEKEKSQVLGRLVAGIAHELKNPLMNLKTAVSLVLTQGDNPKVREAFARFIPEEVDRMNRLVEGLLNYSRPTREKSEVVQLSEIVNSCLYLTHIAAKGNQIRFTVDLDDSLYICVQKDMLRQSLINLLINGIWSIEKKKADFPDVTGWEAALTVRVYAEESRICLLVRDEGTGMTEMELKRCTEPFYTTKKAGTGLGLSLTSQFVQENGGTLSIKSEAGVYTEILIRFRRYEENEK